MWGDKRSAYQLYYNGAFGNKLRTWDSYDEIVRSGYKGLVTIRYKQSWSRFLTYNVKVGEIPALLKRYQGEGADLKLMTFNEAAPDERIIVQGEYMNLDGEEWFFYSTEKTRMRQALQHAKHMSGPGVRLVLKSAMAPSSYADFLALIEKCPDHVVEFSVYEINLGILPGRNTIFWEVRDT
jgi:hypothetical protein